DSLVLRMATVISDEFRAKHHDYERRGEHQRYQGLTVWSPNINLFRDPRWGRGQETYGEDPYLTGRMAVPFIRGLQGDDPRYLKTIATVKHFAVHSGPEPLRHEFDAVVSERDLRESYLPHFETGIREAGAYSLMCAYNRLFRARFRLGMFDPPDSVRWARIPITVLDAPSHRALALDVARESIVLLKNARNLLPLRRDRGTIAVIGPNADQWRMLLGNYNGIPADPVTPLRGIREAIGSRTHVLYARGSDLAENFPLYELVPATVLRTTEGRPGLRVDYFAA